MKYIYSSGKVSCVKCSAIFIFFRQPSSFSRIRYAWQILPRSFRSFVPTLQGLCGLAARCDVRFRADILIALLTASAFLPLRQPSGPCKGELLLQEIQSERPHIFHRRPDRVDFPPSRQGIPFAFPSTSPAPQACYIAISALGPLTSCLLTTHCWPSVCPTRVITRKN